MYNRPEIQSMLMGAQQGRQGIAGMIPSPSNVGGSPPGDMDPATKCFRDAHDALMYLSSELHKYRDEVAANQVAQLAVKVKDIQLTRRKDIAEKQADEGANGGGMAAVAGLNAMGVPSGGQ